MLDLWLGACSAWSSDLQPCLRHFLLNKLTQGMVTLVAAGRNVKLESWRMENLARKRGYWAVRLDRASPHPITLSAWFALYLLLRSLVSLHTASLVFDRETFINPRPCRLPSVHASFALLFSSADIFTSEPFAANHLTLSGLTSGVFLLPPAYGVTALCCRLDWTLWKALSVPVAWFCPEWCLHDHPGALPMTCLCCWLIIIPLSSADLALNDHLHPISSSCVFLSTVRP